jgi:putative lipoic acid-binding regulatory protein
MADEEANESERLLALLESQHSFPGPFSFKIFYRNQPTTGDAIVAAIAARCQLPPAAFSPSLRASSAARFVSMTLAVELDSATQVLEVYAVLKELDSVISYF